MDSRWDDAAAAKLDGFHLLIYGYTLGDQTDQGEPAHQPMPKSPVRDRKSLDALAVVGQVSP
jgi:hypothetical protein